jgi:hypothetical protein
MRVVRVSDAGVVRVMMAHRSDRATHERSQQAVSAVPVGIPCAWWEDDPEFLEWLDEADHELDEHLEGTGL